MKVTGVESWTITRCASNCGLLYKLALNILVSSNHFSICYWYLQSTYYLRFILIYETSSFSDLSLTPCTKGSSTCQGLSSCHLIKPAPPPHPCRQRGSQPSLPQLIKLEGRPSLSCTTNTLWSSRESSARPIILALQNLGGKILKRWSS